jgi:organic radical activating enzyme
MTAKIIRVVPAKKNFLITWNLGRRCNYDCMYCPVELHDSTSSHLSLVQLQSYWDNIVKKTQSKNLKYKISFTGGEVTGNKDFVPFLKWLKKHHSDQIDQILITTNGSATYKYYCNLINLVDNISFSLHSEHVNEQKFFDTVIKLHQNLPNGKHIHVNIMDEYWNRERFPLYTEILSTHNISNAINQIDYSQQIRSHPILKGKLNLANTRA